MTRRFVYGMLAGAMTVAVAGSVGAQPKPAAAPATTGYVAGTAPAAPGYLLNAYPTPTDGIVKSATYNGAKGLAGNLCWRTGFWAPSMATAQCDPDLVPKPKPAPPPAPAPAPTPAPTPAPAPAAPPPKPAPAPAPTVQKVTLATKALFDFDKAVLRPQGRAAIDTEIIARLPQVQKLELVLVTGHTDRIGTQQYNQRLSERRANAVRDYLVSKGVPRDKIETLGMGETQPVPGVVCTQKSLRELIVCLQPHRRVEVEVKGDAVKR